MGEYDDGLQRTPTNVSLRSWVTRCSPRDSSPASSRVPRCNSTRSARAALPYALLGQGRSLVALGTPAAAGPLSEARELFTSMGYAPALDETDALLRRVVAPT